MGLARRRRMIERDGRTLVTLFGGGGFLGRYAVQALLAPAPGCASPSATRAAPIS